MADDVVAFDAHDLAEALAVDGAGAPPFLHGQLVDGVAAVAHADGRAHGAVEEVHDEGELPDQPDQGLLGEVLVAEVGVEGARVVGPSLSVSALRSAMASDYSPDTCLTRGTRPIGARTARPETERPWGSHHTDRRGDRPRRHRPRRGRSAWRAPGSASPCATCGPRPPRPSPTPPAWPAARPTSPARSDVIVVAVVNDAQVLSVLDGDDGASGRGRARGRPCSCSRRCRPTRSRAVAELRAAHGVDVLDCGVSGGPAAAAEGALVSMIGGDEEVIERIRPVLDAFSSLVVRMGPLGAGLQAKLARNLVQYASWLAAYEAQVPGRGGRHRAGQAGRR